MRLSRRSLIATAAPGLTAMTAGSTPPTAREEPWTFRRGVNIHNMMNWPTMRPWPDRTFEWPPFTDDAHTLRDDEIFALRNIGFDFVRLTLQPAIFMQASIERRAELHAVLYANVTRFLAAGLGVVVDPHPVTQHEDYQPRDLLGLTDTPLLESYLSTLAGLAKALAPLAEQHVAIELINEPELGDALERLRWPAIARRLYDAVRTAAPALRVVVTGAAWGTWTGLVELDPRPFQSPRTFFTFHFYEPAAFTHQSALNYADGRYLTQVPWPWDDAKLDRVKAQSAEMISTAPLDRVGKQNAMRRTDRLLSQYERGSADAKAISATFHRINTWADLHRIPRSHILLGEFGAVRRALNPAGPSDEDRRAWLTTVRQAAEDSGFAWAYWAYRGAGGMTLVAEDRSQLDEVAIQALGLRAPR